MKEDWIECQLGEVCDINMGQSPPSSTYNTNEIGLPFFQGKAEFTDLYPRVEKWCTAPTKIAEPLDVLLSIRAPVGATNVANQRCAIGRGLAAVSYKHDHKYILFFLRSIEQKLDSQGTGTTFRAISGNILRSQLIPVAPLPIQRAIVSKIEALFSDLDNGIAHFKKAQAQLKIYRQAVLKKAFEGRFTNEKVEEGELPKGWKWVKLGDVCQKIQIGPFGSQLHEYDYISNNIPLINPTHIKNGKVVPDVNLTISSEKMTELPNYILEEGDVIMGRRGEMGRCALITIKENGWFCGTGSLYFRPNQKRILPKYLSILLGSQMIKSELINQSKGTTMTNLNKKIVSELLIPLSPSLAEQSQIVAEIESRLSVCDKVEQSLIESLEKAEALRQSILKKAFEGKLLTAAEIAQCRREADYAPASELLRRIEQRRNEQKSAGKTAKTKKK